MQTIDHRYKLIKELGSGGMGTVYYATDIVTTTPVAVKLIHEETEDTKRLFKEEFAIMSRLKHPHITEVYTLGFDREINHSYLTMEYINGDSLSNIEAKVLDIDKAIIEICQALSFMHSRGIIHGDITPPNIMFHNDSVRLMDFGLSKDNNDKTVVQGTIAYMAPEVLQRKVSFQSDIFALGLLWYELLSGKNFYDSYSSQDIISLLNNQEEYNKYKEKKISQCPEKFRSTIDKMISYNSSDRFFHTIEIISQITGRKKTFETIAGKQSYVLGAPFTGRTTELLTLKSALQKNTKPSKPFILEGKAGVGKSRLVEEFKNYCLLNEYIFLEGYCSAEQQNKFSSFLPIIEQLLLTVSHDYIKSYGGILKEFFPTHKRLADISSSLEKDEQTALYFQINAIKKLFQNYSKDCESAVILYLSDIHWLDEKSQELFTSLCKESLSNFYIYSTARPNDSSWYLDICNEELASVLKLLPFEPEDTTLYLEGIFGEKQLGSLLRKEINKIHKRVGGSPLFLQEFTKELLQHGILDREIDYWELSIPIDEAPLPYNLEELILKRVNDLNCTDEELKQLHILTLLNEPLPLNQLNSIIEFHHRFIQKLLHVEIIKEIDKTQHTTKTISYTIHHDLIKQSIINTIPEKKSLHYFIAHKLELLYKSGEKNLRDEIGYHYFHGHSFNNAAPYFYEILSQTEKNYENSKAIQTCDSLLQVIDKDNLLDQIKVLSKKSKIMDRIGDWGNSVHVHKQAVDLARKSENSKEICKTTIWYLWAQMHGTYDPSEVESLLEKTLQQCLQNNFQQELADLYNTLIVYYGVIKQDTKKGNDYFDKGFPIAEQLQDTKNMTFMLANKSIIEYYSGNFSEAIKMNQKSIALLKEMHFLRDEIMAHANNGHFYAAQKNYDKAIESFRICEEMAIKFGNESALPDMYTGMAHAYFALKLFDNAKKTALQAIEQGTKNSQDMSIIIGKMIVEKVNFTEGKTKEAISTLEQLVNTAKQDTERADIYFELWVMTQKEEYHNKAHDLYKTLLKDSHNFEFEEKVQYLQNNKPPLHLYREDFDSTNLLPKSIPPDTTFFFEGIEEKERRLIESLNLTNPSDIHNVKKQLSSLNTLILSQVNTYYDKSNFSSHVPEGHYFNELLTTIKEVNSNIHLQPLLNNILDRSIAFFNGERGALLLFDNGNLTIKAARNAFQTDCHIESISKTVLDKVSKNKKALFMPDVLLDNELSAVKSIMDMELRSILAAPLHCSPLQQKALHWKENNLIGIIYLDSQNSTGDNVFTNSSVHLLEAIADQVSTAIAHALINDMLESEIEEKNRAEQEVRQLNLHLEELVKKRTAQLEEAQQKLLDKAHEEGMADIASEVIHNIGNVMNSVLTTCDHMRKNLTQSKKVSNLKKASKLLKENIDTIEHFLSHDLRGKQLIKYYINLGDDMEKEFKAIESSLSRLTEKAQLITSVVDEQRQYAVREVEVRQLNIASLLQEAIQKYSATINRAKIEVIVNIENIPQALGTKQNTLRMFSHIIKNAIDSLLLSKYKTHTIEISYRVDKGVMFLSFTDNGIGIPPDTHRDIFQHGYTTKSHARGFGLHFCANYLANIHGDIDIFSDGEGKGAIVTLTLPLPNPITSKKLT